MQGPRRVGLEGCSAARDARKDRARGPARPGHEREPRRLAGGRRAPVDGDVDEVVHAPLLRAHVEVDLGAWPVTRRCRPTTGYACCQGLRDAALGGETSARHVRPRSGSTCGAARRCRRSSRALGSRGAVAGARERAASRSQAPMSAPSPRLLPSIQRSGFLQVRGNLKHQGRQAASPPPVTTVSPQPVDCAARSRPPRARPRFDPPLRRRRIAPWPRPATGSPAP